jgi:hypothetical protein
MDPVLRRLVDENDIRNLVIAFSLGMDSRDYKMYRASWADEVDLDLPNLAGDAIRLSGRTTGDDYAKGVIALLSQFESTQHVSSNHLVSVRGDLGICTCYTLAQHYMPVASGEPWLTAGARYELTAQRFGESGWRFVKFKLTPLWARGNGSLWQEATRRMLAGPSR